MYVYLFYLIQYFPVRQFNSFTPYFLSSFQNKDSAFLQPKFHPYVSSEYVYSIDKWIDPSFIL